MAIAQELPTPVNPGEQPPTPKSSVFRAFLRRLGRVVDLVGSQATVGTEDPNAMMKAQQHAHEPNGRQMAGTSPADFARVGQQELPKAS